MSAADVKRMETSFHDLAWFS